MRAKKQLVMYVLVPMFFMHTMNLVLAKDLITILSENQYPIAEAGEYQYVTEGDIVTLDGSASYDPDGDNITFSWKMIIGSEDIILSDPNIVNPTFIAPEVTLPGYATFVLTVEDTNGLKDSDDVIIFIYRALNYYYVDNSNVGDPDVNGTIQHPFITIQSALDFAQLAPEDDPIDIIEVLGAGTYEENVTLIENITLRARDRRAPLLIGTITMANNSTLEGFQIESDSIGTTPVTIQSVSDVIVRYNTIENEAEEENEILNALTMEFFEAEEVEDVQIHNNILIVYDKGINCIGRGISILQDPLASSQIQLREIKIFNNAIDVVSLEGKTYGLYIDANNYYLDSPYGSGIIVENNIITIDPGLPAPPLPPNYCIYKIARDTKTLLPIKYNNLFLKESFFLDSEYSLDVRALPHFGNQEDIDPLFVSEDYHLKSIVGRWDPNNSIWTTDLISSPCIDSGNIYSDYTGELWPHGKRLNMGAYGGTPEASMSSSDEGNIANLDNDPDDAVNLNDLDIFVSKWCFEELLLAEDLNRDGIVNFVDFAIFAEQYSL